MASRRWRKLIAGAAATVTTVATFAAIAPAPAIAALPGDTNIDGGCPTPDIAKPALPPWACPAAGGDGFNQGHFYAWHYIPETWPREGGPTQPSYIQASGAFPGADGTTPDINTTMEWIWALGSRAQTAWTNVKTWEAQNAAWWVNKVHLKDGKTATQYLLDTIAKGCPSGVEMNAKVAYTLKSVGSLDEGSAICKFDDVVKAGFDSATGRIGPDINSTVWAIFYLRITGQNVSDKTVGYLNTSALADGGWGVSGFDYVSTSYALMAFATLHDSQGVDIASNAVVNRAIDKLASLQNSDGGWGKGLATNPAPATGETTTTTAPAAPLAGEVERTNMLLSAPVHGALRALEDAGSPQWSKFTKYQSSVPGLTPGRVGIQWLLQNTMQNQTAKSSTESRFQCSRQTNPAAAPEGAGETRNSLCGARAVYNHIFWHPIVNVTDNPDIVNPTENCPAGTNQTGTDANGAAICTAVEAQATPVAASPSFTG